MSAIVYVIWNSQQDPAFKNIIFDEEPKFKVGLFDYTGRACSEPVPQEWGTIYSHASEGKGDILNYLLQQEETFSCDYAGFIDDDILIRASDINRALQVAEQENLASFQPCLARCSHYTFGFTLYHENSVGRRVGWVEIMMPFYKKELLQAAKPFIEREISISSWGIDAYVFPMLAHIEQIGNGHAVIDVCIAAHTRPITSGNSTRRNGLTAREEMANVKIACKEYLKEKGIDWEKDDTLSQLFDF